MSRQLLQVCRKIPLANLKQGGTLSIQSKLPLTRVKFIPEWRDDGHLTLTQWMNTSDIEADVSVTHESDKMTSLGRTETHLSVCVFPLEKPTRSTQSADLGTANKPQGTETLLTKVNEPMIITDDGEIQPDSDEWHGEKVKRVEYSDGITHVSTDEQRPQEPSLTLTAVIPEKTNIICELLQGGDIGVDKKVEGDAHLMTTNGNVRVHKLRGHQISISAQGEANTIFATDLLEAQKLNIDTRGRVRAKKVHGSDVNITVNRPMNATDDFVPTNDVDDEESLVDISSIYVAGSGCAEVSVSSETPPKKRAVRIKSHHGHVVVETNVPLSGIDPCVELGGVNGSFDVMIRQTTVPVSPTALAGRVHVDSLARDSVSMLNADGGNVSLTLDRKAEADLRMLSSTQISSFDAQSILLEDDDPGRVESALRELDARSERSGSDSRIRVDTSAFTARANDSNYSNIDYVDGWVENKSNEPDSRFDLMTKGGKIQLQGAAEQALKGFSSSPSGSDVARPLVAIATDGTIALESLSWFGAIARRYGLEEIRDDLGRTARRAGRPLIPKE